jgi:phage terminase Nu1 subunit (DNA packaging protein)
MIVNKAELSDVLGVSSVSLTEWQKEDPPLPIASRGARRGQSHSYDTAAVIEWMVQRRMRSAGLETPRDRLMRLQAEEVELRIAEKRGELVNVAQLEPELVRMVGAFRSRLLQMADQLANDLSALHSITVDVSLIEAAVHEALTELSQYDPDAPKATPCDAATTAEVEQP